MSEVASLDSVDVPWGKYTYAVEGLATGCYLEGAASDIPGKRRLRFRVELPSRCFVMAVSVKLSNGASLHDITMERTVNNADFDIVYDGRNVPEPAKELQEEDQESGQENGHGSSAYTNSQTVESKQSQESASEHGEAKSEDQPSSARTDSKENSGSKSSGTERSVLQAAVSSQSESKGTALNKKHVEIRRAANSLRLVMTDVDDDNGEDHKNSANGKQNGTVAKNKSGRASSTSEMRVLSIAVTGYTRGQTPPSKGLKLLLNVSAKLDTVGTFADRSEVHGLLGLAFLGNRRYRQAAEILRRAAELTEKVAGEDAKAGFPAEPAVGWSAQLNLLSAHAFFEHLPLCHDGTSALLKVASACRRIRTDPAISFSGATNASPRDIRDYASDFLDLRTELLSSVDPLMRLLVSFLGESESLAVRMASARMIEFVAEQLGCAVSPYMSGILKQVLRSYPHCKPFNARDRPAANSFSYDSMEDCYERLIDICCKMLPISEHTLLQDLFDRTLVPIFQEAFKESEYLIVAENAEDECDELLSAAVAQTLRVSYLVLRILEGDARIPPSFISRIINILTAENGIKRTPILLRRTALHAWDAVSHSLALGASGVNVKDFKEFLVMYKEYLGRLTSRAERPDFNYGELDKSSGDFQVFKEDTLAPANDSVLQNVLGKRKVRTCVVDNFTLVRLLQMIKTICTSLEPCNEDDAMLTAAYIVFDLQGALASTIADLLMTSLVDVSFHEACVSGNGKAANNLVMLNGSIHNHLKKTCEVVELLFDCYWGAVSLLPAKMGAEAERTSPVHGVLAWSVHRMRYCSPPPGMLILLSATIRGLKHERNVSMRKVETDMSQRHDCTTFIQLYRTLLNWLPRTSSEHALGFSDHLLEVVVGDLSAHDVVRTVEALSDQSEHLESRAEKSLNIFAELLGDTTPNRPDVAVKSLRELVDPSLGKQRILDGFPKASSSGSQALAFVRKVGLGVSMPPKHPMIKSFYLHVVLASCFDKFDSLGRLAKKKVGPSYMSERLDSFIEHAALLVRCLAAVARAQQHRQYIFSCLGDVFGSCLAMQDHVDGRVRLAGFEILSVALDVLFLARGRHPLRGDSALPLEGQPVLSRSFSSQPNGIASIMPDVGMSQRTAGPPNAVVTDLDSGAEDADGLPASDAVNSAVNNESVALSTSNTADGENSKQHSSDNSQNAGHADDVNTILIKGGVCCFQAEQLSSSRLTYEDQAWQTLCMFMTSSLGVGKYVDFVVQRACLEYLQRCLLDALSGKSSGASVLSFEHVEQIWDAVMRLIGSPWRTLNALSFWVSCAVLNVAFYSTINAKGRQAKIRSSQLDDFAVERLFPAIEKAVRGGTRETRHWGVRLLEVYLKAQERNGVAAEIAPRPRPHLMHQISLLCHDWCPEIRALASMLRDLDIDISLGLKKAPSAAGQPAGQSSLSVMKRQLYNRDMNETADGSNATSKIELWFPPLPVPKVLTDSKVELFGQTLEAFANAEIMGGEEVEEVEEEQEAYEGDDDFDEEQEEEEVPEDEEEEEEEDEEEEAEAEAEAEAEEDEDEEEEGEEEVTVETDEDVCKPAYPPVESAVIEKDGAEAKSGENRSLPADEITIANEEGTSDSSALRPPPIRLRDVNVVDENDSSAGLREAQSPKAVATQESTERTRGTENATDSRSGRSSDRHHAEEKLDVDSHHGRETKTLLSQASSSVEERTSSSVSEKSAGETIDSNRINIRESKKVFEQSSGTNPDVSVGDYGDSPRESSTAANQADELGDIQEKMPGWRLRRKGSFTGTSRTASMSVISGEGEAPKLSRRRINDQGGDAGMGLSSPSPRTRTDIGSVSQPLSSGSSSFARRRSGQSIPGVRGASNVDDSTFTSPSLSPTEGRQRNRARDAVGSEFLGLLPKTGRVQRGVKLDDDDDEETQPGATDTLASTPDGARGEDSNTLTLQKPSDVADTDRAGSRESRSSDGSLTKPKSNPGSSETAGQATSSRPRARKLPRAAAFLKSDVRSSRFSGGRSPSSGNDSFGRSTQFSENSQGMDTLGSRTKAQVLTADGRPLGSEPWEESVSPDRSNRYGKRDLRSPFPFQDRGSAEPGKQGASELANMTGKVDEAESLESPLAEGADVSAATSSEVQPDESLDRNDAHSNSKASPQPKRSSRRIMDSVHQFNSAQK